MPDEEFQEAPGDILDDIVELQQQVLELTDKVEEIEITPGPKGDKGDPGPKPILGVDYFIPDPIPGKNATPPSRTELISLIKPLIPPSLKGDKGDAGDAPTLKQVIGAIMPSVMARIPQGHGGGQANRNIAIGGNQSVLSRYGDINFKAGSNVTIIYSSNNATKFTDVTISSSGGGGSVGGTVRSINSISTSQTAGSDSGTDYVYICSAGINLTLPDAVGNTNLYTVKNTSTSSVIVTTTSAETIDTAPNIIMPVQYTSIDLISDSANWQIT